MSKFKVGDKVKCIRGEKIPELVEGMVYSVKELSETQLYVGTKYDGWTHDRFEIVPQFKAGDPVRCISGSGDELVKDRLYLVDSVSEGGALVINGKPWHPSRFEPSPIPRRIALMLCNAEVHENKRHGVYVYCVEPHGYMRSDGTFHDRIGADCGTYFKTRAEAESALNRFRRGEPPQAPQQSSEIPRQKLKAGDRVTALKTTGGIRKGDEYIVDAYHAKLGFFGDQVTLRGGIAGSYHTSDFEIAQPLKLGDELVAIENSPARSIIVGMKTKATGDEDCLGCVTTPHGYLFSREFVRAPKEQPKPAESKWIYPSPSLMSMWGLSPIIASVKTLPPSVDYESEMIRISSEESDRELRAEIEKLFEPISARYGKSSATQSAKDRLFNEQRDARRATHLDEIRKNMAIASQNKLGHSIDHGFVVFGEIPGGPSGRLAFPVDPKAYVLLKSKF